MIPSVSRWIDHIPRFAFEVISSKTGSASVLLFCFLRVLGEATLSAAADPKDADISQQIQYEAKERLSDADFRQMRTLILDGLAKHRRANGSFDQDPKDIDSMMFGEGSKLGKYEDQKHINYKDHDALVFGYYAEVEYAFNSTHGVPAARRKSLREVFELFGEQLQGTSQLDFGLQMDADVEWILAELNAPSVSEITDSDLLKKLKTLEVKNAPKIIKEFKETEAGLSENQKNLLRSSALKYFGE